MLDHCKAVFAAFMFCALSSSELVAAEFKSGGLRFSDEYGGMIITGVSGSGTNADPFIVYEDFTGEGPAILTIKDMDLAHVSEGRVEPERRRGFALIKVVTNKTKLPWTSFEMELRELRTRQSNYGDGLSFAQSLGQERGFAADKFAEAYQSDEPIDALTFYSGSVAPGETVQFRIRITDFSPRWEFYLFQRQDTPLVFNNRF